MKKVEELAKELSLANDSIEEKMIDIATANSSIDSLKDANVTLQENLSCLEGRYKDLEVQFASLWESNSLLPKATIDSNVSTSKGCNRCFNHDMDTCATNLNKVGKLENEVKLLKILLSDEMLTKEDGTKKEIVKRSVWGS